VQDLGTLGGTFSSAFDINDAGTVIGTSYLAGDVVQHFFIWSAGTGMRDLTTILGTPTSLVGINNGGQIAGTFTTGGASHAFLYTPGSGVRDLGTLGGTSSRATGLNNLGQVVGSSTVSGAVTHAFLWTPSGGMEDITAITGIPEVHLLNDALQTLTGRSDFVRVPDPSPRMVQLSLKRGEGEGIDRQRPVANFTVSCKGMRCVFDATGSTDDVGVVRWDWDWADGQKLSRREPTTSHAYLNPGRYEVVLLVTDAAGLTGRTVRRFTVSR
jgi:probable HAF family extracellular repeat protein